MDGDEYLSGVAKKYRYIDRLDSKQREGRGDLNRMADNSIAKMDSELRVMVIGKATYRTFHGMMGK